MHYPLTSGMDPPEDRHSIFPYKTVAFFLSMAVMCQMMVLGGISSVLLHLLMNPGN